jgi:hypothetical protein
MGTGMLELGNTGYAVEWVKVVDFLKRAPEQRGIAASPELVAVAMDVEEAEALGKVMRDMGRPRVIEEGYDPGSSEHHGDDEYQSDG